MSEVGHRPVDQQQPPFHPYATADSPLMATTGKMKPREMGIEDMRPGIEDTGRKGGRRGSKRCYIILAALICVVVVGVAVGVGVGLGINNGGSSHQGSRTSTSSTFPTSSPTASPSLTTSSSPTASPFTILSAVYGLDDVTDIAVKNLPQGNDIVINTSPFIPAFPDSESGHVKCLSLLHRYGNNNQTGLRTFVGCENTGEYTLRPGDISLSNNTQPITNFGPFTADFHILSVVWQQDEIRNSSVYQALFDDAKANQPVVFSNEVFGFDPDSGQTKAAAIFYTVDNFNTFQNLHGIEGANATFEYV